MSGSSAASESMAMATDPRDCAGREEHPVLGHNKTWEDKPHESDTRHRLVTDPGPVGRHTERSDRSDEHADLGLPAKRLLVIVSEVATANRYFVTGTYVGMLACSELELQSDSSFGL